MKKIQENKMKNLLLEPTGSSPLFEFSAKGCLVIEGKAIILDSESEFTKAVKWCEQLLIPNVNLTLKLDLLNAKAAQKLHDLFYALAQNKQINRIYIFWYVDNEDSVMIETGNIFKEEFPEIAFEFYRI